MEIFAVTPEHLGLDDIANFARRAEAMGYDGLFVADAVHDGMLLACLALAGTTRIKIGISVLVAFARSPMNVALAAWDLQKMSGGRFELALGTQIRQNIEERYGARWLPPAKGMKEYLAAMRAIFRSFRTGEALNYVGEFYKFTRLQPFFNPGPIDAPEVPLSIGAVGPKMLALAGSDADGMHTHPTNTSARYLREVIVPAVAAGARHRLPGLLRPFITANPFVATGPDAATVARERERFRALLAFLFSTPAYWPSLEMFGWKAAGEALLQLTHEKNWKKMSAVISDVMLDEFVVCGTYANAASALRERFDGLADRITVPLPEDQEQDAAASLLVQALRS